MQQRLQTPTPCTWEQNLSCLSPEHSRISPQSHHPPSVLASWRTNQHPSLDGGDSEAIVSAWDAAVIISDVVYDPGPAVLPASRRWIGRAAEASWGLRGWSLTKSRVQFCGRDGDTAGGPFDRMRKVIKEKIQSMRLPSTWLFCWSREKLKEPAAPVDARGVPGWQKSDASPGWMNSAAGPPLIGRHRGRPRSPQIASSAWSLQTAPKEPKSFQIEETMTHGLPTATGLVRLFVVDNTQGY
ncbi:hypothetical protein ACJZ2D_002839 [Fusarium nematophilum]